MSRQPVPFAPETLESIRRAFRLAADREVPSPRPPAELHADAQLGLFVLPEEAPAQLFQPGPQRLVDAVPDDVEEAVLEAGLGDPAGGNREDAHGLCREGVLAAVGS